MRFYFDQDMNSAVLLPTIIVVGGECPYCDESGGLMIGLTWGFWTAGFTFGEGHAHE